MLYWTAVEMASYTLYLNVTKLSGNIYANYTLRILSELAGTLVCGITLHCFSRRLNLFIFQLLLGLFCVILAFLPKSETVVILLFYLLAGGCTSANFFLLYLVVSELYPTNLRSQALGTCSNVARAIAIAAPLVPKLVAIWKPLPMIVLGLPPLCTAFLVYLLPETKQTKLPQTMNSSEQLSMK